METHQRRKRYKGKYPKHFNEKYKELNANLYQDEIAKRIKKGITPAGMHIPIMVNEVMDVLNINKNDVGADLTLGYGGHSIIILEKLDHTGHLYAFDVDSIEMNKTIKRLEEKGFDSKDVTFINSNFKDIDVMLDGKKLDFLFADLGVSSMQIDNPMRGFSFKNDGPLDLRLDPTLDLDAKMLLQMMNKDQLEEILVKYSDLECSKEIATHICKMKSYGLIDTTKKLFLIVKDAVSNITKDSDEVKKICQRVFQALRIEVNKEYEVLNMLLQKLPHVLNKGARICFLTFHSGEDRIVKKAFKDYYKSGVFKEINDVVIRPSIKEINDNPRSKSTKLRWAIMN